MKISRRIPRLVWPLLVVTLTVTACAARNPMPPAPAVAASAATPSTSPHCSDRVDRARAGSLVGTVLGTLAATLIGSPVLGLFYNTAGYVLGFASDNPCPKTEGPVKTDPPVQKADATAPSAADKKGL